MSLSIYCLCAEWCNTCTQYRSVVDILASERPMDYFEWIDVEDNEQLLGDLEITNFPTVLIANAQGSLCFAGPVMPHPETLARLCDAASLGGLRVTPQTTAQWAPMLQQLPTTKKR